MIVILSRRRRIFYGNFLTSLFSKAAKELSWPHYADASGLTYPDAVNPDCVINDAAMTELLPQISAYLLVFMASPTMYAGMLLIMTSPRYSRQQAFVA